MKRINLLLGILLALVVLSSCQDKVTNTYQLSNEIKALGGYPVGTKWGYDVEVNDVFDLEYMLIVRDTIVKGDTLHRFDQTVGGEFKYYNKQGFEYDGEKETGGIIETQLQKLTNRTGIPFDSARYTLKDSVYLFGEYRVFTKDSIIMDTFRIFDIRSYTPTYDENNILVKADSVIVLAYIKRMGSVGPLKYDDLITATELIQQSNVFQMGNTETHEEMMRNRYESELNKNESYFDVFNASSNGTEIYKRDVATRDGKSYGTYSMSFMDGQLDQSKIDAVKESGAVGTYDVRVEETAEVNGKVYNNVRIISTRFEVKDHEGFTQLKDMEYWLVPGVGIIKKMDKNAFTTWSLKP